ncbi:MAG TPA: CotH kinase family protein, partial [Polyangiales bacterium]|nr:CotH kinase family protein [Polyangiales bacterium]
MSDLPIRVSARRAALLLLLCFSVAACQQHKSHRAGAGPALNMEETREDADVGAERSREEDQRRERRDDPDYLFDPEELRTFELRLSEDDLAFLDDDPKAEQYVPGELHFEGRVVKPVGIRYKGSSGAFFGCLSNGGFPATGSKICPKLSMKVKIDYSDPDAKFHGQKKLMFHAMNLDRSLLRERLGYSVFRDMDVHASRTTHARLLINGQFVGLFLLVEEIDGRFTRERFGDGGKGNLYKEVWPIDDDADRYLNALESNRDEDPQVDKMLAFARDLREADDETLPQVVADWLDRDYTARFVAVDRTIRHDDGPYHWYCQANTVTDSAPWHRQHAIGDMNCGNHNYYWYEDSDADRFWPIPWDLDNAFPARPGFTFVRANWDDLSYDCQTPIDGGVFGRQLPAACDPLQRGWTLNLARRVQGAQKALVEGPLSRREVADKLDR